MKTRVNLAHGIQFVRAVTSILSRIIWHHAHAVYEPWTAALHDITVQKGPRFEVHAAGINDSCKRELNCVTSANNMHARSWPV